jgi:hypothetical protein
MISTKRMYYKASNIDGLLPGQQVSGKKNRGPFGSEPVFKNAAHRFLQTLAQRTLLPPLQGDFFIEFLVFKEKLFHLPAKAAFVDNGIGFV